MTKKVYFSVVGSDKILVQLQLNVKDLTVSGEVQKHARGGAATVGKRRSGRQSGAGRPQA